jgi:hypothetical protein
MDAEAAIHCLKPVNVAFLSDHQSLVGAITAAIHWQGIVRLAVEIRVEVSRHRG